MRQVPLDLRPYAGVMPPRNPQPLPERVGELDANIGGLLDDIAAEPDHKAGVTAATGAGNVLRRHMERAASLRRSHLDAAIDTLVAEGDEPDLSEIAELAGGVSRERGRQLRNAARARRAETSTLGERA